MDPYQILGISPDASDDEVKKAYRTLSKKYHPDANVNSDHQAEYTEKFKQVQTAYKTIMDNRKRGFTNQNYGGQTYSQQSYGGQSYNYTGNDQRAYQDVAAYINAGRYQDALNILDQMKNKTSMWFYYSALAMNGIGNTITALEYAQTAARMEPGNLQYVFLVQQLQASQGQYRNTQQTYGSPFGSSIECCYNIMLLNLLMSCCCRC